MSGEPTYYCWRPPALDGPVVAVNLDPALPATLFQTRTLSGTITNSYGLHNEEYGAPIFICRGPKLPLDEMWPRRKACR